MSISSICVSHLLWECTSCALININKADKIRIPVNDRYDSYKHWGSSKKRLCIKCTQPTQRRAHMVGQYIASTHVAQASDPCQL